MIYRKNSRSSTFYENLSQFQKQRCAAYIRQKFAHPGANAKFGNEKCDLQKLELKSLQLEYSKVLG